MRLKRKVQLPDSSEHTACRRGVDEEAPAPHPCLEGWRRDRQGPWHVCLAITTVLFALLSYLLAAAQQLAGPVDGPDVFRKILQAQVSVALLLT